MGHWSRKQKQELLILHCLTMLSKCPWGLLDVQLFDSIGKREFCLFY